MKILYLNPSSKSPAGHDVRADWNHDIVVTNMHADALDFICNRHFDAVVVENDSENGELLDFTVDVCGLRPSLPVFLTSDWGTDLPMGLGGVCTGAFAG